MIRGANQQQQQQLYFKKRGLSLLAANVKKMQMEKKIIYTLNSRGLKHKKVTNILSATL